VETFVSTLLKYAPIDHLVYSAVDNSTRGPLKDLNLETTRAAYEIKFWGAVTTAVGFIHVISKLTFFLACAKHDLITPGGSLTLTSGTAAINPGPNASVWGGLNGAVISLTHGLAIDLAFKRIRVNTVIPGIVDTELWEKLIPDGDAKKTALDKHEKKLLVGKLATAEDIAESYIYFMRADYSNGATVIIDGGGLWGPPPS